MSQDPKKCPVTHLTTEAGAPVVDNQNSMTAGARGPLLAQDLWLNEKLANFVREVIPERRMHAKGSGAFGTFTVTNDITQYTRAKIFSEVGKKTEMFARFSTVAGERGAVDAERDIRGFALKFYTEEGNWDLVGNNTPVFFLRDARKFPDLNKAVKRDPKTNKRSATNNWDFWTLLPEAEQILVKEALKPYREHLKLQLLFDELSKNSKRTEYEGKFIQLYESYQKNELDPAELNILKVMCTRYHKFKAQQLELKDLELYLSQIQKKDAGKKRKAENQRKFEVGGGVLSLYKIKNDDSLDPKNFLNRMKSDRYFAGYLRKSNLYKQVWALDLLPAEKAELLFEVLHQILSFKNNDTGTNIFDLALSKAQRQLKIKKEQSQ